MTCVPAWFSHLPVSLVLLSPARSTSFQNDATHLPTYGATKPSLPSTQTGSRTYHQELWPTRGVSRFSQLPTQISCMTGGPRLLPQDPVSSTPESPGFCGHSGEQTGCILIIIFLKVDCERTVWVAVSTSLQDKATVGPKVSSALWWSFLVVKISCWWESYKGVDLRELS